MKGQVYKSLVLHVGAVAWKYTGICKVFIICWIAATPARETRGMGIIGRQKVEVFEQEALTSDRGGGE